MNPFAAEQIALDNALVAPEVRLTIGKCNSRIAFTNPQREATYQVTLDALKLSPCYLAFLITVGVPKIYMHQFWNTITKIKDSYTGNIKTIPELVIDHMHQPWRTVAAVINSSPKEPTKKPRKAKKDVTSTKKIAIKPKLTKKKTPVKADKGVPDKQQCKISGTDEGTDTKPWVSDVPKYESKSDKESWDDSGEEEDDDKDDTKNDDDNDNNNSNDDDDSDHERTELDIDENPNLNHSNKEYEKEEENEEEDTHVTLTAVYETQKTEGPMKSYSVSSDFIEKLLNFKNVSPADNEIASLMDTTVHHEEPSSQTSSLYTVQVTIQGEAIQQCIKYHVTECREEALVDSKFATPVIEQNVTESLEAAILAKSSSQPKSTYEAAASLSEFELTSRDDKDKDQDPSAGSDRGTKRRKSSKDVGSSRDPKSKESKSTSSSKGTSHSQHKSTRKSADAEQLSHTACDLGVQHNQEFYMGNNDEQPNDKAASKVNWFEKPERPSTPDPDWNKIQHVDFRHLKHGLVILLM
nr:hypothetical protein [Tanacetum cinerariifolium]